MSKLSKLELFYLEQHADQNTPEELASDMGVSVARVKTALKKLHKDRKVLEAVVEKPESTKAPERAKPVVMTDGLSHQYDEARKLHHPQNGKLMDSISIVDPKSRIY